MRSNVAKVAAFARLMKAGNWRLDLANPKQPVILRHREFAGDIVLEDGVTRLTALVTANTVGECYVDAPADLVIPPPQGRYLFPVSPARAAAWLGAIRPGRGKALAYAVLMEAGQWRSVPEDPVRLSRGDVLDGAHRLLAVILADETMPLWADRS
jgi:hypothetical protein